jgi:EAL and modified HD-GYP domain-containing signal transduction protein
MTVFKAGEPLFPFACLQPVSNVRNEWVALILHLEPGQATSEQLDLLFNEAALLDDIGALPCLLPIDDLLLINDDNMAPLVAGKGLLYLSQQHCGDAGVTGKLEQLRAQGLTIFIDGLPHHGTTVPGGVRSLMLDCGAGMPEDAQEYLEKLGGPHLACNVGSPDCFIKYRDCGFDWFSGEYALQPGISTARNEGTSRTRLLKLLGLVARDADSHELEVMLKQDPALSYHLLKLVNSAAFALASPITSFAQAINVLGRRQLQRWLQLLLYAKQQDDGAVHPLLPFAALRASFMEALSQHGGGSKDEQDQAFMVGMFSLLDTLFSVSMEQILRSLNLEQAVLDALLHRSGHLGLMLHVVERATTGPISSAHSALTSAAVDPRHYWRSVVQAYRWTIQVVRDI